jgi:recombination protein U
MNIFNGKAFFKKGLGTVDYHGMYRKQYFCIEAKTTALKSFNINKIPPSQYNYLQSISDNNGFAFVMVCFNREGYKNILMIE